MIPETVEGLPEYAVEKGGDYGFDDVIAHLNYSREKQIKFSTSDITLSSEWKNLNMELFLAKKKKLITTAIENPTKEKTLHTLLRAKKHLALIAPKDDYYGIGTGGAYKALPYDGDMLHHDEELMDLTKTVIEKGNEYAPEVAGVIRVGREETILCSSRGVTGQDRNSYITLSIRALRDDSSGHGTHAARTMKNFHPLPAARKAGAIARDASSPHSLKKGKYTLIFDPLSLANLVSQLIDFFSIFSVESGFSCLANKIGEKIAHDNITLYDDGGHPGGIHSQRFDAEGTPTQRTPLIEKGVLTHYLHNASTARKHGTTSTGNAGMIAPHPWNAVLAPGGQTKDELFTEASPALYITNVWYTRFQNYLTGDFSTIPRDGAFLINKDGLMKPVHHIRISDNILSLFAHMEALSNKQEHIYWWETATPSFVPYAVVKNVNITTSMG